MAFSSLSKSRCKSHPSLSCSWCLFWGGIIHLLIGTSTSPHLLLGTHDSLAVAIAHVLAYFQSWEESVWVPLLLLGAVFSFQVSLHLPCVSAWVQLRQSSFRQCGTKWQSSSHTVCTPQKIGGFLAWMLHGKLNFWFVFLKQHYVMLFVLHNLLKSLFPQ